MKTAAPRHLSRSGSQGGFTLPELLVALVLSVFLLGGLFFMTQMNKKAFQAQANLSQQNDTQIFAMTVLNEVITSTGYFPNPVTQQASSVFLVSAPFTTAGQSVTGTGSATGTGTGSDTLSVAFYAAAADNLINCDGSVSTGATPQVYINAFSINASNQLVCKVTAGATVGTAVPIADSVSSLQVLYGIRTNPNATSTSIDTFKPASSMAATDWLNVISVQVTLVFNNTKTNGVGPDTISLTRTIALMNKAGS